MEYWWVGLGQVLKFHTVNGLNDCLCMHWPNLSFLIAETSEARSLTVELPFLPLQPKKDSLPVFPEDRDLLLEMTESF